MGTANRDASVTTTRRKQIALYGYRLSTNYPNGINGFQRPEQPVTTGTTGSVPVDAYIGAQVLGASTLAGACACTASAGTVAFDKKAPGC